MGKRGAEVRWGVAGRMVVAWITTLPAAGLVGALCWFLANAIGGAVGTAIVFTILVGAATWMFLRSHRTAITPANVNAEWQGGLAVTDAAAAPAAEPVAVGTRTERN